MSRVVMFVMNDCTKDARVLREAATLAEVGHEVTIMARPRDPMATVGDVEQRDGFTIRRIPIPYAWRLWWTFLRYPWRMRRWVVGRVRGGLVELPVGLKDVAIGIVVGLGAMGWSLVRAPFYLAGRAVQRTSPPAGGTIDWLVRWRWATLGWAKAAATAAPVADVYHGHDLHGLAAAGHAQLANGGQLVYDSHEIFLESGSNVDRPRWARMILARMERRLTRRAAALVTVNDAVGAELVRRIRPARLVVVHNCPPRWERPESIPDRLREAAGIPPEAPVLLYHGGFSLHRGLEQMALASLEPGLERCHVVYLGYGSFRSTLEGIVAEGRFGGRLHILDAVAPDVLIPFIATADVGVIAGQHSTLNHYLSSPNKLFESLAAGVPVVIMDFPYVHRIVMDDPGGNLGVMCDPADPASIAAGVRSILALGPAERKALTLRCQQASHDRWNWETESIKLVALYASLMPSDTGKRTTPA